MYFYYFEDLTRFLGYQRLRRLCCLTSSFSFSAASMARLLADCVESELTVVVAVVVAVAFVRFVATRFGLGGFGPLCFGAAAG